MNYYSTNEMTAGVKVLLDGEPCIILKNDYVKPGKGQAFNRLKLRTLKTGRVLDRTLKSGDRLEAADIVEVEVKYLYHDGSFWHFMAPDTFEQYAVSEIMLKEAKPWLKPQVCCTLMLFNSQPLGITPPNFVILEVSETDPGLKGDTSSGGSKPAVLETGAVVRVPLFVQVGNLIKVDTREGSYLERVKT
jgi:elongation factor P